MAKNGDDRISELLERGVEEVIDKKHLASALASGAKLRVKLGIDPTAPDLHLGNAVVLRKLKAFQELGHTVVLIIGDFTARIGDPSGRSETRKPLSKEEIKRNEKEYLKQAGKVIDVKKAEVAHNSDWLGKEGTTKLLELAGTASMQQILRREDFKNRLAAGGDITVLEILYPLFQGYDSVKMRADVELGGTDQLFNLLMGRQVQKRFGMKEQDIMTVPLLEGLDGKRKMSKSYGNYIGLDDAPDDMFGKMMSVPDALMEKYFALCTEVATSEIAALKKKSGPKDLKERLAFEVVKLYHGGRAAAAAQDHFEKLFSKHEMPEDVPQLALGDAKRLSALDLVMKSKAANSKSEARRLIEQGGLDVSGKTIKDPQAIQEFTGGEIVRIGKKRFFKLKI